MIKPVNGHILITPESHNGFVATQQTSYDEIGIVLDSANEFFKKGTRVYFDSWLAKKYPIKGEVDGFYWLVHESDVVATEEVSE